MESVISVGLCADKNIEVGLHVTLYSLMQSSQCPVKINLICKGYSAADIDTIHKTLQPFAHKYQLNIFEFDEMSLFGNFSGLHGNKFNFTKLVLANLLPDDRIIYLDSDLCIHRDLQDLFNTDLNGFTIGASAVETIADSLRSSFYQSIGMNKEAKYFNSGVMLMDLKKWRELDITAQCLAFANQYLDRLAFGDEAILNCIFYENLQIIDRSYNHALYPTSDLIKSNQNDIFHFVGSPKPFDFLGESIHTNFSMFYETLARTNFRDYKSYRGLSIRRVKRMLRLSRSYYRCLGQHLRHKLNIWNIYAVPTYPLSSNREYNADEF
jgi:lipopolysaccharide biosynthesis glycosyltransferase